MLKNKKLWFILIVAALIRLYHLAAISLWHDEAFSALLIRYPWGEMFYRIGLDVHPPLYYMVLRVWSYAFGQSLFSLRAFSAFFGVATVWAAYMFMKEAFEREGLALAASLLIALSPFQIQYVTEARMYTLGTFLLMISAYLLVKSFKTNSWKWWVLFGLSVSAALYTHYYELFSEFAIGIFGLYYLYRKNGFNYKAYGRFFGAYLLAFLVYVPWLKTFMFQFRQVQANYWIPAPDRWSVPLTNWRMLTGAGADAAKTRTDVLLVLGCLFTLYMLWRVLKRETSMNKWLVVFAIILPFLGSLALSFRQSIYLDRYFLFAALFYSLALAIFIFNTGGALARYTMLAIIVIVSVGNWTDFWRQNDVANRPGLSAAAAYISQNFKTGDRIYIASSFEFFNFKYYDIRDNIGTPPLLYTPGIRHVSDLPHYSGTAILTDADLIHNWNAQARTGDTVWVVWTYAFGGSRPNDIPSNWLPVTAEKSWGEVRPYPTDIYVDQYKVMPLVATTPIKQVKRIR